ncbi:MAG TPA: VOC family protein [Acidimicrobiia bacterium]|nr:VOC family protein [Acidimicrobiia bacterium]
MTDPRPLDVGLSHVALAIADADRSIDFYARYAGMQVVHRRTEPAGDGVSTSSVVWLSDLTRPFVVVLIETDVTHRLGGFAHLGVGCTSRAEVDRRCALARDEGRAVSGPFDSGPPVGYWAIVADPDGHNLELSHGQEVAFTVERHAT